MAVRRRSLQHSTDRLCALALVALLLALLIAAMPAHASRLAPSEREHVTKLVRTTEAARSETVATRPTLSPKDSDAGPFDPTLHSGDATAFGAAAGVPSPTTWYRLAGAEYGVSDHLLRALHQVESNAAPTGCVANLEGSGALGPFQFKPATFRQYGVDANYDGDRDICSFPDALFSAARYLRSLGVGDLGSPETRLALVRYGTDPERVLALAHHYRATAACDPGC